MQARIIVADLPDLIMTMLKALPSSDLPRCRRALSALCAAVMLPLAAQAQTGPQPKLPTIDLQAGMHIIKAEVAQTGEQQMAGMMFRR